MGNPEDNRKTPGNQDDYDRGEGKFGDSGRSEDWTSNQRYGERQDWEHEASYGTDWEEGDDKNLWDANNDPANPANRPNPEALTSGQSGPEDVNVSQPSGTAGQDSGAVIRSGAHVADCDGNLVGRVKAVREHDFLLDRPGARDIYVPLSACQPVGDQLRLNLRADEIERQAWEMPPVIATPMTGGRRGFDTE